MAGGARPRLLAPSCPVEHDDANASRRDGRADGLRMRVHRRRVRPLRHQPRRLAARPARGPEQVAVAVAMVADDARASPTTRPQARHHALLTDPGLVLEPHFYRARRPARPERRTQPRRHKRPEPGPERRPRPRTAPRVLRPSRNETPPSGAAGERSRPHTPLRRPPRSSGEYRERATEPRRRAPRPDPTPPNPAQPPTAHRRENTPSPPRGRSRKPSGPSAL